MFVYKVPLASELRVVQLKTELDVGLSSPELLLHDLRVSFASADLLEGREWSAWWGADYEVRLRRPDELSHSILDARLA